MKKKKKGIRAIDGFRKKLMIPDYEISKCPEHEVKSNLRSIFMDEKILEKKSVKIYEINPYFYEHYKEKIETDKNDREYTLFRIDIYFTEYFLAVEIDEKGRTDRDIIFEEKRQKALEKNLTVNLLELILVRKIMMQTMRLLEDTFISKFKDKENENKIKELEDEIKKLKL